MILSEANQKLIILSYERDFARLVQSFNNSNNYEKDLLDNYIRTEKLYNEFQNVIYSREGLFTESNLLYASDISSEIIEILKLYCNKYNLAA